MVWGTLWFVAVLGERWVVVGYTLCNWVFGFGFGFLVIFGLCWLWFWYLDFGFQGWYLRGFGGVGFASVV